MIRFILNDQTIQSVAAAGSTLLDLIRYRQRLTGTKIGCREGDCGACTVLVGEKDDKEQMHYQSMTSCLMPLANAAGKHIVTVEGINGKELTPVQQAMVDCNGTQCGFCTPGFVMSLTGFVLEININDKDSAIKAMDGNICRCTGYKSIERAAAIIAGQLPPNANDKTMEWLVKNHFIPAYFLAIPGRLASLKNETEIISAGAMKIAGGTDLLVQKHSLVRSSAIEPLFDSPGLKEIQVQHDHCEIGASVTVSDFAAHEKIADFFPQLKQYIKLISSTPIRNMATIGGNIVNASPIGDMAVFFLALDAYLLLDNKGNKRRVLLKEFFKGYKQLDKGPEEIIEKIIFPLPSGNALFNFEKVSKRRYLDIASVNSACLVSFRDDIIEDIHLSAGGVAPYPTYLSATCNFLIGKKLSMTVMNESIKIMNEEIAPISDARGTACYKRLLLRQLLLAHILHCSPLKTVVTEYLTQS